MNTASGPCDLSRLRRSLDGRISDAEQAELAAHLETCTSCQQELERLAAASRFWGDARLLQGEPGPEAPREMGLTSFVIEGDEGAMENAWLRLLDPPEGGQGEILGRLGQYEVLEIVGQGGMGVVLKARDPALDRTVAIKILTPNLAHVAAARRRFAREARAAAAVGHEHVVAIHAVDEFRGLPYLVMQYIPGRSLQERLDASGPLDVKEILRIGMQAARALAAAHAQGVVHRDIKPANILLENCVERVKLTDFGLARRGRRRKRDAKRCHRLARPSTWPPSRPAASRCDARADLFSLGAVLYAMAAGRPPFRAGSAMAVLKRVCDDRHRSIREAEPRPARLARGRHRSPAGQGPRSSLPVSNRGGRSARARAGPRPAADHRTKTVGHTGRLRCADRSSPCGPHSRPSTKEASPGSPEAGDCGRVDRGSPGRAGRLGSRGVDARSRNSSPRSCGSRQPREHSWSRSTIRKSRSRLIMRG